MRFLTCIDFVLAASQTNSDPFVLEAWKQLMGIISFDSYPPARASALVLVTSPEAESPVKLAMINEPDPSLVSL